MSFWTKIRDALRSKVQQAVTKTPEPKLAEVKLDSAPKVALPPVNPAVVASRNILDPYEALRDPKAPKTLAEALRDNSFFDPIDVVAVMPDGENPPEHPRIWPKPHPEMGENAWGYATRCSYMDNPATGKKFYEPNLLGFYHPGYGMDRRQYAFVSEGKFAHVADFFMYPENWRTPAENARRRAEQARDEASKATFSPR